MNRLAPAFKEEVLVGLRKEPKRLSSKYFYDDQGSKIFREIMDMPEYYLPEAELEIIQTHSEEIAQKMNSSLLDVIELGAGDGRKMVHFIKVLSQQVTRMTYLPLDISEKALALNEELMKKINPNVHFQGLAGDYFKTYQLLQNRSHPRLVIFAGSNIGNFREEESIEFLKFIKKGLRPGDYFILGVDLKKNPRKILQAYDDPHGITKRFNLNLLQRINRELGADFNLRSFDHYATYHPVSGACESFIVSLKKQRVTIGEECFEFDQYEVILTEISQKFDRPLLNQLSAQSGFELETLYSDLQNYFSWALLKAS